MKVLKKTGALLFQAAVLFVLFFGFILLSILINFPSSKEIRGCFTTKMYQIRLCPTSDDYIHLNAISPYLQKAVVLTEDSSFWVHQGFDWQEVERSLKANIDKGHFVRGGSTITQQLAKNLYLTREKTLGRKLMEALITLQLERSLSKREILERYLNVVQFGKDLFGIKRASEFYFHKSAKNLSLVESVFLTFLLPNPESYSRSYFRGQLTPFATTRLNQIVDRLYEYGRINNDEYAKAKSDLETFLQSPSNSVETKNMDHLSEEVENPPAED